jgi:uncharacterized protein YdeI (YjbR/CyaY-like superfamily)
VTYAEAGLQPQKETREIEWPPELAEALDADPELAAAFHSLTAGRQRSHLIQLNSAKKPETRQVSDPRFPGSHSRRKGALER